MIRTAGTIGLVELVERVESAGPVTPIGRPRGSGGIAALGSPDATVVLGTPRAISNGDILERPMIAGCGARAANTN